VPCKSLAICRAKIDLFSLYVFMDVPL
jgi:hypothetical protein